MLQRAFDKARHPLTVWRLSYNLPPNDPRVESMTEAEAIDDLLVRYYAGRGDPEPDIEEVLATDPERSAEMAARARSFLADPGTQERLALLHGKKQGKGVSKVPSAIRIKRRKAATFE